MKVFHIVKTYFKREKDISDSWLQHRWAFFTKYTLQSLLAQTFKNFNLWICCYNGIRNVVTESCMPIKTISTFDSHYPAEHIEDNADYVCITRIDSDDLYRKDALEIIHSNVMSIGEVESPYALMFRKGFLYDINNKKLGIYFDESSPFHSLIFPTAIFTDKAKYERSFIGDHSKIRRNYPTVLLPEFKFCVLIHDNNFGSTFESLCKRELNQPFQVEEFIHGNC